MAIERRNLIAAMIMLGAGAVVQLYAGVITGLRADWAKMTLALFVSVLLFFYLTICLLGMKLSSRLTRLEDRLQIDRKARPKHVRRVATVLNISVILSIGSLLGLSAVAGSRADWFRLGVYLTVCAVVVITWTGVLTMTAIGTRLSRLEQRLAGTRKEENA